MANSFGGTIKLTGESEYTKALKTITSNLTVLSSEMKVVSAEYGSNDKSVEALTSRNNVLNKEIEEGKKKVDVYKSALTDFQAQQDKNGASLMETTLKLEKEKQKLEELRSSTSASSEEIKAQEKVVASLSNELANGESQYEKNKLSINKYQTQMNNAEAEVIKMSKEVDKNNESLNQNGTNLDDTSNSVKDFKDNEKDAQKETITLGDLIKADLLSSAIKTGIKALASGIKEISSSMASAITTGASYADNMLTLSTQTGIEVDKLQEYNAIAELTDVPLETITKSMAKMTKSLESNEEEYNSLGVSIRNADGSLRDNEDIFNETIGALGKMTNETERDALAMSLFGKSAQDLNPLIAIGTDGLNELTEKARNMGAVLSSDGIEALGKLDDEFQIFKSTTSATGNILASAFAPALTMITGGVNDLMGSFNQLIAGVISNDPEVVTSALDGITESVNNLVTTVTDQIPQLLELAGNLITTIGEALVENLPVIVDTGMQVITSLLNGITNSLSSILPVVIQVIMQITSGIINNLPTILTAGIQVIVSLITGIVQALPTLIPQIIDAVILMADTLLDNIDLIIDAGIQLIFALADGLLEALPDLIDKIPTIIDKLVTAITDNLPKIIEMGIVLTVKLAEGLIKAIPQLVSKIPQIISSLINGIKNYYSKIFSIGGELLGKVKDGLTDGISKITDVGKNLVQGLWNGINNAKDWVLDKVKGFGKSVLNGLKSFFGINSPSTVFRDEIGSNLALGIGEGFENEMSNVTKDIQDTLPTDFDLGMNTNISGLSTEENSYSKDVLIDAFKEALSGMSFKAFDETFGELVIDKVEKVVYS